MDGPPEVQVGRLPEGLRLQGKLLVSGIPLQKPIQKWMGFQRYRWGDSNSQALRH